MLCVFGKGRLGMDPEQKVSNASGDYYKVRIAVNRMGKKAAGGVSERETLWCSGLVHEGKMTYQKDKLKKGSHVTFVSNRGWINQWTTKTGQPQADIDLGFIALIEAGGDQEGDQQQASTPAPAPVQAAAPAPASMPAPAHVYAPAPAQAPTQVWNGKGWVAAPPQQSAVSGQVPAPQIQKDNSLPF